MEQWMSNMQRKYLEQYLCCNEMCLFQLPGEEEGHEELHEVATPNEVEKLNS